MYNNQLLNPFLKLINMDFYIDPKFKKHFRRLKQVFLYINDECNLDCIHCLYKPELKFHHSKNKEIPYKTLIALILNFKKMGANKLSILGGEPTLYGAKEDDKKLKKIIEFAKKIEYEYVRLDTNGQFKKDIFKKGIFNNLDELSFSLDGFSPKIHDYLRGKGSFAKCVSNIKKAVNLGYNVTITCCIHRKLLKGSYKNIEKMIRFVESLGIKTLNFHVLFKSGFPMDTWTEKTDIPWKQWVKIYPKVYKKIENNKYKISVRIPQRLVKKKEFAKNANYYGFCPAKLGERVLVHPNGIIRICSGMIGTPYGVARFSKNKITWDYSDTNELRDHNIKVLTPCTNQSKSKNFGEYLPLCFSLKPKQKEIVWEKLHWENKKK